MDDIVDPFQGSSEAFLVSNIANEESDVWILLRRELLGHLVLLQFIP